MPTQPLIIPRPKRPPRARPPKANFPPTPIERARILQSVRHYVAEYNPVPPLPLEQLKEHANQLVNLQQFDPRYRDYISVLINNEMWRETLASVPFERRLLLLPKCLRVEGKCPAKFDEFGLVCKSCGQCSIQDLQTEAERLGYAVLVAEGSPLVMSLIQAGRVDAIIGVSCLNVLERAFPYMESAAIPGLAVPLLQDDCADTSVDLDWVWDYIHLTSADQTRRLDLGALREEVEGWFTPASLEMIMGGPVGETERIGRQWLMRAGKRWRPFLAVAAYQALQETPGGLLPEDLRKIAIAVECFHKASLIHDDIEDNDTERYGEATLHREYGLPVALNVGDLLIGEGYRLIALSKISAEQKVAMLRVAADGQRQLCHGQGAELCWMRQPVPLSSLQVLDIFRRKTAPAFEVALRLGALYAGVAQHDSVSTILAGFSEALGIAYQIRDDLDDWGVNGESNDLLNLRPGLLMALAHERAVGERKTVVEALWRRTLPEGTTVEDMISLFSELKVDERGRLLLEAYQEEAIRSLRELDNPNLKGLLRRVVGKIFNPAEIKGWCKEFEPKSPAPPEAPPASQ